MNLIVHNGLEICLLLNQCRLRLECDGTRAETSFRLSAKRTSPFKSAVVSVHSTTGSRVVRISGSNAGYTMFRGSVKGTAYPLHSPFSTPLSLPCVTMCHHISTWLYYMQLFSILSILDLWLLMEQVLKTQSPYSKYFFQTHKIGLNFRRRIKSRLPFAGIIRRLSYSTRFQDKG